MDIVSSGQRVVLTALGPRDLETLARWDEDPEVTRYAGKRFADAAAVGEWWRQARADARHVVLAIRTRDGRVIGDVELVQINWARREAELRIRIGDRRFWSRGYGREAVEATAAYAARRGLWRLYLRVDARNERAIRCYLRAGFRKRGRLVVGRRQGAGMADMYFMERSLVPAAAAGHAACGLDGP